MSDANLIKVKYRLTDQIAQAGGMTVAMAMDRVGREMAGQEGRSRECIGESISKLEALCREQTATMDEVYAVSTEVIDIAGLFDDRMLCESAYSLCELADRQRTQGKCEWPAVVVHTEAMRLIYSAHPTGGEELKPVVAGLWKVTDRYKE